MDRLSDEEIRRIFAEFGLADERDRLSLLARLGVSREPAEPIAPSRSVLLPVTSNESTVENASHRG